MVGVKPVLSSIHALTLGLLVSFAAHAQKYDGPRPPKPDVPYLVHADNLIPCEAADAKQSDVKEDTVYTVPGLSSPARTPLAEPIFLIQTEKLSAEKMELYRLEVKDGSRRIVFPKKKKKDSPRPLRILVTQLAPALYRLEANETLEEGEYSLTPAGSNEVFCFQVY